ncbi:hypothetical protein LCGC14_1050960 [marine sediment metagenome]|uniref:LamG-like jellyroll fold domain-containing protein n=1 Tax=marine sediment metagenome TaxID=412755 RepID=A0A0F9QUV7_9ZZZZ
MAKRIYTETVKKWFIRSGIIVGTLIGGIFLYLIAIGAISNVSYSGDVVCAGTSDDPCHAYINFTANEDIFIYPIDYDPWGRNTFFDFDPAVKSWKLERSWGKGWREIDLTTNCKGTWCGAPDNSGRNTYSIVFRDGKDYQIRITGYKNNPTDDIKWGAFSGVDEIDPIWFGNGTSLFTIGGNSVWIDDSKVLINITPHTSNYPVIEFKSKVYSGDVDIVLGFDTTKVIPKEASTKPHLENITNSYTCNFNFNYTLSPNHFWCYKDILTFDEFNVSNGSYVEFVFEHDFDYGFPYNSTAYWTKEEIVWDDVSGAFSFINYDYQGFNRWYYKSGININANQTYKLRLTLQPTAIGGSQKYFFGIKPSFETLSEAIANGNFYYIDPWTEDLNTGLIGYFALDSTSGTVAIDSLDISNGTLTNMEGNEWNSSGKIEAALEFDHTSDATECVVVSDSALLDGIKSVSLWYHNRDTAGVADGRVVFTKGNDVDPLRTAFTYEDDSDGFRFYDDDYGIIFTYSVAGGTIEDYHFVLTLSGTNLTLYVDGEQERTGTLDSATMWNNNFPVRFGGSCTNNRAVHGQVDELGLWNVTLNGTQVTTLYNSDVGISYGAVDTTAPTMTLLGPNDGLNSSNTSQVFAVNVYDGVNVDTVILYGDFSGSWAINTTNSSGLNNTDYNVTLGLTDGTHTWAYWSNDTTGNSGFTANRTLMIDTTTPYIAFNAATEANATVKSQDWVYANVTVTETNEHTIVFAIFNGSGVVNSTQFTSGSVRVINWTGLADAAYEYNVTVNDTFDNSNTTETRIIYLTTFSLFLNGIEASLDAELNSSINLIANSTAPGLTICIDIDHPDFGINYTCETSSDYNVSANYFRKITFSDLTTNIDLNFSNYSVYNLTFASHQYDEVDNLKFNISGIINPVNTIFFRANTTPDITNLTQYEPLIDRYYDGNLVGSNIYDFELFDGSSSANRTFQSAGTQLVYLLIDDILQNSLDYTFFLNVTGFLFGFSVDYGNHPGIEGHSVGDGVGFLDYDFVDTDLTTAQIDRSGAIMAGNASSINHVFDDFEDGALDQSLWQNGTCTLEGTYIACSDETGGNLRIRTWANVPGTAHMPANTLTQGSPFLPFSAFETEVINFSIVVDYDGTDSSDDSTLSTGWAHVRFFDNVVWDMVVLDIPSGTTGAERADADIDFMFEKINRTHWRMTMWGTENSTAPNNPSSPSNIVYSGDQKIVPIDNWNYGIEFYVKSYARDGETTNTFYVSEVNRTAWNRANSTLISKSIFDSSGFIDGATMEITLTNNSAYNKGDENISLYMSADDGDNWELVTWTTGNESEFGQANFIFANQGNHLKFRIDFNNTNWNYNYTNFIMHLNASVIEGNVSNLVFDFGNDGTGDVTFSGELNSTNNPQEINLSSIDISSAFTSTNRFTNNSVTYPHLYKIPLSITSDSRGTLQIDAINLTYNPNPISLNTTSILNILKSSVNLSLFRIPMASSNSSVGTNASINFNDIRYDYAGGSKNITITLHDPDYTLNVTYNITYHYSRWDYSITPDNVNDIEFIPNSPTSLNVTPFGQTSTVPILNISNLGYSRNADLSAKINETFGCVNLTIGTTNDKIAGAILNDSWQNLTLDTGYLQSTDIYLWGDYNCGFNNFTLFNPYFYFRQCAVGAFCSEDI